MKFAKLYPIGPVCLLIASCGQTPPKNSSSASNLTVRYKDCNEIIQSIPLADQRRSRICDFSYADDGVIQTSRQQNTFRSANKRITKQPVVESNVKENQWEVLREQYNVAPVLYTIDPAVGDTIVYKPSGTTIVIPPHAFELNGIPVTDEVTVEYREFHTIKEIFFSGIPMDILLNGEKNIFESNGMYELKTKVNNSPCEIIDENPLILNMALNGPNEGFNFYTLDEASKKWTEKKENTVDTSANETAEEVYYTEEIVFEKPSLGIQLLDKNAWKTFTWGQKQDSYFKIVFDPVAYPELSGFKEAVFQVHEERKDFTSKMRIKDTLEKKPGLSQVYTLCNEMVLKAVKDKPGYVEFSMQSKGFNSMFECIIYVPELKTKEDFKNTLVKFEQEQTIAIKTRNDKREKVKIKHVRGGFSKSDYAYVPNKLSQATQTIREFTQFEAPVTVRTPGIGNWDKPIPIGPPLAGERRIEATVAYKDHHAPITTLYAADVTKNRMLNINSEKDDKFRFNIAKEGDMMIWAVDEFGNTGMLTEFEIDLDDLKKRASIELPVYPLEELSKKLETLSVKALKNRNADQSLGSLN